VNPITITERASEKIREMIAEENDPGAFLRLGVRPGGCTGFTYSMGLDTEESADDVVLNVNGLKVVVDKTSLRYLHGLEIDYKETAMGGGFSLNNPNATATCGCGLSFRTASDAGQAEPC